MKKTKRSLVAVTIIHFVTAIIWSLIIITKLIFRDSFFSNNSDIANDVEIILTIMQFFCALTGWIAAISSLVRLIKHSKSDEKNENEEQ